MYILNKNFNEPYLLLTKLHPTHPYPCHIDLIRPDHLCIMMLNQRGSRAIRADQRGSNLIRPDQDKSKGDQGRPKGIKADQRDQGRSKGIRPDQRGSRQIKGTKLDQT